MRSTQFIGLTKKAQDFVEELNKVPSDSFTEGMFNEKIPLGKWECPEEYNAFCIREVVQVELCSSEPMIFTYLALDYSNKTENPEDCNSIFLEWIRDPSVGDSEVDYENGSYWV